MSTTSTDLGSVLNAAIQGGYVAHLAPATYTITQPIVIHVTSSMQGPLGLDGGGSTFVSQVASGQPVIQFAVDPGVDLRYLQLSNFTIAGNGQEGDGISIVAPGNDSWVYNWSIDGVTVQHVGGYGLDVQGSVFEGTVSESWMIGNAAGGARFAHDAAGGTTSALRWLGGGFEDNGGAGLMLANGARDISVEGAEFTHNGGFGISAEWGITSVRASDFVDNHGAGIWFQNFASFNDNSFSTAGVQAIGVKGYLAGNATLIDNHSAWTGSGADSSVLANVQGNGGLFLHGGDQTVTTGSHVLVSGAGGGNLAHVFVDTHGVALPEQAAVTLATIQAMPDSIGTGAVESALRTAIAGGTVAHLQGHSNTITSPIVINITSSSQAAIGIDLGGAKLYSQIANGGPAIEIIVAPGVDVADLTLSNFSLYGNGGESAGIRIVANGADRSLHLDLSHVNIEHVGGIGLDVLGNVSGTVFDSWMQGNAGGGARFAGTAGGFMPEDLEWIGGGFRKNGGAGLILDGGAHDMTVRDAYFVENDGPGIYASAGIAMVRNNGFENNLGTGAIVEGSASFVDNTFSTHGPQQVGIGGHLEGGTLTLIGDSNEYYGTGPDTTRLANVQGTGTLGIAGGGNVVVGHDVTVTGANPVATSVDPPIVPAVESNGSTSLIADHGRFVLEDGGTTGPSLKYHGADFIAGQSGAWTPIAAEAVSGGYDVAFRSGAADQYTVWHTDSSGNYASSPIGVVSGSDYALQTLETRFVQDLNNDGRIGLALTEIEAHGATALEAGASRYFFGTGVTLGASLKYLGADYIAGQSGAWAPIAAEAAGGGYDVAFRFGTADQYTVWHTDSGGNYTASLSGVVSGHSYALEALEDIFHQDLNRDGTTGPITSGIEAQGATSLVAKADEYVFETGGASGPSLKYLGTDYIAGQSGAWTPIAAEAVSGGYDVAFRLGATDQYTVWRTDSGGNYVSSLVGVVSGNDYTLQKLEDIFHQDVNKDGTIGLALTQIEAHGATALEAGAGRYFFETDGTPGPSLKYQGADFIAGQSGAWAPIAAEAAAGGGYDVVFKFSAADQYTVWHTDGGGNYASSPVGVVSGNNPALHAIESRFAQDLDGNGFIG